MTGVQERTDAKVGGTESGPVVGKFNMRNFK